MKRPDAMKWCKRFLKVWICWQLAWLFFILGGLTRVLLGW
jgi:hypothetical protein